MQRSNNFKSFTYISLLHSPLYSTLHSSSPSSLFKYSFLSSSSISSEIKRSSIPHILHHHLQETFSFPLQIKMLQDMWNAPPGFRPTKSAPASPAKPLGVSRTRSDSFHVAHKVPVGDTPYVRAKNVQVSSSNEEE